MNPFPTTNTVPGNIKYMASRPFKTEDGEVWPGDDIDASKVPDIQLLVQAGFVVPYAPNQGYSKLPAHLWTYVQRKTEAQAKLDGDSSARRGAAVPEVQGDNSVIQEAEKNAKNQAKLHTLVKRQAQNASAPKPPKKSTGSVEDTKNQSADKAASKAKGQTDLKVASGEEPVVADDSGKVAEEIKQGDGVETVEDTSAKDSKATDKETGE